jgi:hypothetical protein
LNTIINKRKSVISQRFSCSYIRELDWNKLSFQTSICFLKTSSCSSQLKSCMSQQSACSSSSIRCFRQLYVWLSSSSLFLSSPCLLLSRSCFRDTKPHIKVSSLGIPFLISFFQFLPSFVRLLLFFLPHQTRGSPRCLLIGCATQKMRLWLCHPSKSSLSKLQPFINF